MTPKQKLRKLINNASDGELLVILRALKDRGQPSPDLQPFDQTFNQKLESLFPEPKQNS